MYSCDACTYIHVYVYIPIAIHSAHKLYVYIDIRCDICVFYIYIHMCVHTQKQSASSYLNASLVGMRIMLPSVVKTHVGVRQAPNALRLHGRGLLVVAAAGVFHAHGDVSDVFQVYLTIQDGLYKALRGPSSTLI